MQMIILIIVILIIVYLVFRNVKVYPNTSKGQVTTLPVKENFDQVSHKSDTDEVNDISYQPTGRGQLENESVGVGSKNSSAGRRSIFAGSGPRLERARVPGDPFTVNDRNNYFQKSPSEMSSDSEKCAKPSAKEIMKTIQEDFLNTQFRFNVASLPITTIVPNTFNQDVLGRYTMKIRAFIDDWNNTLKEKYGLTGKAIKVADINLLFIEETASEFVLKANIKITYLNRPYYLKTSFYGWADQYDLMTNREKDKNYYMQMYEILPITEFNYGRVPEVEHNTLNNWDDTFRSYEQDRKYVQKVRNMHAGETDRVVR